MVRYRPSGRLHSSFCTNGKVLLKAGHRERTMHPRSFVVLRHIS
jgi:hypothetical protein